MGRRSAQHSDSPAAVEACHAVLRHYAARDRKRLQCAARNVTDTQSD
eukprot:SAG11_NODE_36119_length_263_cov_0.634146_1_plen_46_part_10